MMNKSIFVLGTILAAAALVVATLAVAPMQASAFSFGDNQQSGSFNTGFSGNNANKGGRSGTVGCGSCFAGQ